MSELNSSNEILSTDAFSAGADLWVIKNDPSLPWWSKMDLASGFLLSENFFRAEKKVPAQLINILEATKLDTATQSNLKNYVLLGTQDHFLNKWVLIWNPSAANQVAEAIEDLSNELKFSTVRVFSDSGLIQKSIKARPTASSLTISFIENT